MSTDAGLSMPTLDAHAHATGSQQVTEFQDNHMMRSQGSRESRSGLTALTLSPYSTAISSIRGAIIRHGPHHGAQKSTNTGTVLDSTRSLNVLSVTGPAATMKQHGIRRSCLREVYPIADFHPTNRTRTKRGFTHCLQISAPCAVSVDVPSPA